MTTKKRITSIAMAALSCVVALADSIQVETFRHIGPIALTCPVQLDSTDVNATAYDTASVLNAAWSIDGLREGAIWSGEQLPSAEKISLNMVGCQVSAADYFKGSVTLANAPKQHKLYIDGTEATAGALTLTPGSHTLAIKYIARPDRQDSLRVIIGSDSAAHVQASQLRVGSNIGQEKALDIETMMAARRYTQLEISADGKWLITGQSTPNGEYADYEHFLVERASGRKVRLSHESHWLPRTSQFYQVRRVGGKSRMVVIDPTTLAEEIRVKELPEGHFEVLPTEDRLLVTVKQEGPKELNPEAFQFLHPDDRQPGWRDRSYFAIYDIKTGVQRQVTFGYNSHWMLDISADGKKLLFAESEARLTARPTTLINIFQLDLESLQMDTLVWHDGFLNTAAYSPDAQQIFIVGTPECLNGVGNVVPDSMTASMYDYQLYVMDIATRKVT
ncbi:MAG: hypothetical protein J6W69_01420, partial [Bacteroidales bacterium]|nr:hypothetical protein [Bacteroidales bacterium]